MMSFWHGIDTILVMENGRRARALCNVPNTLEVFNTHFPRFPVLPGVLILESMNQLASSLLAETGGTWHLQKACQVRFRRFVQPGCQMEIEVEMVHLEATTALLFGVVKVDQRVMTTVRQLFFVSDAEGGQVQGAAPTKECVGDGQTQGAAPTEERAKEYMEENI